MTYNYITQSKTILGDLYTPVGVYMRLRDLYPQSVLMESSDYHDSSNSRSFICINPIGSVSISHGEAVSTFPDGSVLRHPVSKEYGCDLAINDFLECFRVEGEYVDYCGLYGYTAFNAVRYFEDIAVKDETMEKNDAPDMFYILYRDIIVFDHHNSTVTLVTLTAPLQLPPRGGEHGSTTREASPRGGLEGGGRDAKLNYLERKEQQKKRKRLEKSIKETEDKIAKLEERISELDTILCTPEGASDMTVVTEYTSIKKLIDEETERWGQLVEEMERAST
jgi:anthranilate/para-aminobenzoate synthase component I